jgi:excisionase family DNA binding protein
MTESDTKLFTISETAEILKVSVASVYRIMARGELGWHNVGGLRRVGQKHIDKYLNQGTSDEARNASAS